MLAWSANPFIDLKTLVPQILTLFIELFHISHTYHINTNYDA